MDTFQSCMKASLIGIDLPLEPSSLLAEHMHKIYKPELSENRVDLRGSSYKKIGKFLKKLHKLKYLEYKKQGSSHEQIVSLNYNHKDLINYIPIGFKKVKVSTDPKPTKQVEDDDESYNEADYPKVQIVELFRPKSKAMNQLCQLTLGKIPMKQRENTLEFNECRDVIVEYAEKNDLLFEEKKRRNFIKLDPILGDIVPAKLMDNDDGVKVVRKDKLFKDLSMFFEDCYEVKHELQLKQKGSRVKSG